MIQQKMINELCRKRKAAWLKKIVVATAKIVVKSYACKTPLLQSHRCCCLTSKKFCEAKCLTAHRNVFDETEDMSFFCWKKCIKKKLYINEGAHCFSTFSLRNRKTTAMMRTLKHLLRQGHGTKI